MRKRKKGFTLIELIAVIVILGILALVVVPLVLNIIRRAKDSTNKRSVDGYGRAVDLATKVECNINRINPDDTIYLSECKVNGKYVKDDKNKDGYYHYGILKMTNQEYVDTYGKNLEDALKAYHDEHDEYPSDYTTLELPQLDKEVLCDIKVNYNGTIYLTNCKVDIEEVLDENNDDGYYHYGEYINAAKYILKKSNSSSITNYTDGNTHEMYTFEHPATEQTGALTDYRYIGSDPYNYVTFNNELWRIIGVFTVEDENGKQEQRIKIVRNEKLTNSMKWDSNNINEWSTSSLNTYLNGDYYNGMNPISKSMIKNTIYYLGGNNSKSGSAGVYYNWERGTTVYSGRSTSWAGKIALIYPSDIYYTYSLGVDDACYIDGSNCGGSSGKNNSWFYNSNYSSQWYISPYSSMSYAVFRYWGGSVNNDYPNQSYGVCPTLYISPSVKIISGTGKSDDPYQLSID